MNHRKLLICSPSNAVHGGVENIVSDLCREMPSRGWDAILALAKGTRFNNVEAYRSEYPGLSVVEIDGTKGTRQARLDSLAKLIRTVQPEIVLSARIFDVYESVSLLKRDFAGLRLAVTIQAYEPHYLYDARLYRNNIGLCITAGNLTRAAATQWSNLPDERVVSIPNGVNAPLMPVVPRRSGGALRIAYVGRLEEGQKRISDLAPFLEGLDNASIDCTLDIVGTGPAESLVKERLSAWVNRGKVMFHGWQARASLYSRFYPNLDCLIHFAHTEGVPIVPGEALMHGVVPVISEFTGLKAERQFINENNALTFAVGDTGAAARQVSRLVGEPGLLERLSGNAVNSLKGKYTFAGSMDAWADALDGCLEQPPTREPVPKLTLPADGRLTRLGLSPRMAQRIRDSFGKQHIHSDPGSEWPTGSGLITAEAAQEIARFAIHYEETCELPTREVHHKTEAGRPYL
jgi:glycosyltransferase involved in cell wall biosynthesis